MMYLAEGEIGHVAGDGSVHGEHSHSDTGVVN